MKSEPIIEIISILGMSLMLIDWFDTKILCLALHSSLLLLLVSPSLFLPSIYSKLKVLSKSFQLYHSRFKTNYGTSMTSNIVYIKETR